MEQITYDKFTMDSIFKRDWILEEEVIYELLTMADQETWLYLKDQCDKYPEIVRYVIRLLDDETNINTTGIEVVELTDIERRKIDAEQKRKNEEEINYSNLIHTLKRLHEIWNLHEIKEENIFAEILPAEKENIIGKLKSHKNTIAFIGDGINDAPALATASVGIAMGTGTDIAIESAGITLLHGDISKLVKAVRLSKLTMKGIICSRCWII
jgi:hydroxymethylpyrimidine pyrophosphatase-like HAD family hydrolase